MNEKQMTREAFLQSVGARSRNKYWSWSAVNEEKKWVIFGAWDVHTKNGREMILSENWRYNEKTGNKQPGYSEGYQNIQLIEQENYELKTYSMILEEVVNEEWTKAKIKEFIPKLQDRKLIKSGNSWYAVDNEASPSLFPEEDISGLTKGNDSDYIEGSIKTRTVNAYERSPEARKACIEHYGCCCSVCGLNFSHLYGEIGEGFIHVHHIEPIHEKKEEYEVHPTKDLIPVCPNCHAMIHQTKPIKTIEEMKRIVEIGKRNITAGAFK